jgi:hypothetical protein
MDFDQLCESWRSALDIGDEAAMKDFVASARHLTSSAGASEWNWLGSALQDENRKWFVAALFDEHSMPKCLFDRMLHAGVLERNPSFNRSFIRPCLESFGATPVLLKLFAYLQSGNDREKAGAASALYWVEPDPDPDLDLRERIRCQMLREFVSNEDIEVRRRIIPMLVLDESKYPEDVRHHVSQAIEIARAHADEYLRHRVEIQLGAKGPFMAIPGAGKGAFSKPAQSHCSLFSLWWQRFSQRFLPGAKRD